MSTDQDHIRTAANGSASACTQAESTFEFTVDAPVDRVAPLMGAEGERVWAGEAWNPLFVHPFPARDTRGAVFQLVRSGVLVTCLTTAYDLESGRIQHVFVHPGIQTVLIDIGLEPLGPSRTRVQVTYARTALSPDRNDFVCAESGRDALQGPEWSAAIAAHLEGVAIR